MRLWMCIFWTAAALLIVLWAAQHGSVPRLSNDAYQYLSITQNLAEHGQAATSIVHFDVERSHGRIPAPETTFPPGYPLLVAALYRVGLPLEQASLAVSLACHVLTLLLLLGVCRMLALPWPVTGACALLWIANYHATYYALSPLSEAAFTAIILAAALMLIAMDDSRPRSGKAWHVLVACLLLALAYWVRYAGLLLVPAFLAYGVYQTLVRRKNAGPWIASLLILLAIVAAGMLRNIALTGTWQGGNTKPVSHSPLLVAKTFVLSIHQLAFGNIGGVWHWQQVLAASAYLGFLVVSAYLLITRFRLDAVGTARLRPLLLIGFLIVTYSAGLLYLGLRSPISFGPRLFYPMLPFLLLAGSIVFLAIYARLGPRMRVTYASLAVACLAAVTYMNLSNTYRDPAEPFHRRIQQALDAPVADGSSAYAWLQRNIPLSSAIVAADGQATAYLLQRKTVSLVSNEYSDQEWSESAVQDLMKRFHADYLILYPAAEPIAESPFLMRLLTGSPPPWLSIAAENPSVRILRRQF